LGKLPTEVNQDESISSYYANHDVRARVIEFLGGNSVETATCAYLTSGDVSASRHTMARAVQDLPACFDEGLDISRSLWDRQSLLVHLDVEYVNFDHPAEAYLEPQRAFEIQRPVELGIEALLLDYGLTPLHLLSGRGHHFVWRVEKGSRAFERLGEFGRVPPSMKTLYAQPHVLTGECVEPHLGAAYAGLGLVMEYLAHRVKEAAARECAVSVELTALAVGPGTRGREMVSIDISEYGDPLNSRVIRVPFSVYLKPSQQRAVLGEAALEKIPPLFMIPLHEMDSPEAALVLRDAAAVANLARRASAEIPDRSGPMEGLIAAYAKSSLRDFHDWFYSQEHDPPETWPQTYDRTPLDLLPGCARYTLERPNDVLLTPSGIQRVVRVMLALGWHPRHIAGLIRSKYERDFRWGEQWHGHDPAYRADFYTRLFSGLFATGVDDLVDFNCQSAKEEKLCFLCDCPDNLAEFRKSLLERRYYERLGSWPFNRLFLPAEHL